jgi:hypothetical protein
MGKGPKTSKLPLLKMVFMVGLKGVLGTPLVTQLLLIH